MKRLCKGCLFIGLFAVSIVLLTYGLAIKPNFEGPVPPIQKTANTL